MGKHLITRQQRRELEAQGRKYCSSCKAAKPVEAFHKDPSKPDGRRYRCGACESGQVVVPMAERHANAACRQLDWEWRKKLQRYYAMTKDDYYFLFFQQNGRCAICGRAGVLYVDHDHTILDKKTSVRGLLCHTCNSAIGFLLDDPAMLRSAIAYLDRSRTPALLPSPVG